MKTMCRNRQKVYYCLRNETENLTITDEYGNIIETGEKGVSFDEPVMVEMVAGQRSGTAMSDNLFGDVTDYSRVLYTEDMNCPIEEGTVLFVEKEPEFSDSEPLFDYIVRAVYKTLNTISYAVKKVSVS